MESAAADTGGLTPARSPADTGGLTPARSPIEDPLLGTTRIASLLRVSPRTAAKLVDQQFVAGHRVPGGQARRVLRSALIEFMRRARMPDAWIAEAEQAGRRS